MLQFRQNSTSADIIVTLTEKVTIVEPYYLFRFIHVLTKDEVTVIKATADDLSAYPDRYNKFNINPSVVFALKQPGEWFYKVYQQDNNSNTDPDATDGMIEQGKLMLDRATDFSFTEYETATAYKVYNG